MPGKGIYFQIHMPFTVSLLCIRFLVCQVGGELSNYYEVNWQWAILQLWGPRLCYTNCKFNALTS